MKCKTLLLLLAFWWSTGLAQTHRSAIFLGNSYTYANDLPLMVKKIAESKGNQFSYATSTAGGAPLSYHASREVSLNLVHNADYDYMILQEQSVRLADNENGFAKYFHNSFRSADILNHHSKLANNCHKTLFYLTWGRKEGHGIYQPPYYHGANYGDMQDYLTENYSQLAEIIDASVAPVGEAWRKMINQHPNIELYTGDGSHPNVAGTYLAACVFYQSMFQDGLEEVWRPDNLADSTAQKLRDAAYETVTESWKRWNIDYPHKACSPTDSAHNTEDWSRMELELPGLFNEIHFNDSLHGFLKGRNVWQTIDAGDSWEMTELPTVEGQVGSNDGYSYDVYAINPDTLWFAVGGSEIDSSTLIFTGIFGYAGEFSSFVRTFRSTNGGKSWEERSPERLDHQILDSALLRDRFYFNNVHLYFEDALRGTLYCNYGDRDTVQHVFWTDDGGVSWKHETALTDRTAPQLWFKNIDEAYKSSYKDSANAPEEPLALYQTLDRGQSWQVLSTFPSNCCKVPFYNVDHSLSAFSKFDEDLLFAANSLYAPTLFRSTNGGSEWDSIGKVNVIGEMKQIIILPNGSYLAAVQDYIGRVLISHDEGKSWEAEAFFDNYIMNMTLTSNYVYLIDNRGGVHRKALSMFENSSERVVGSTFSLFPNPAHTILNIGDTPPEAEIKVYNTNGALVKELIADSEGKASFSTIQMAAGLYTVQIAFPTGMMSKKLIIASER